jgi:hypothetical protein
MFKITMLAVAATVVAVPAFAQEGKMALGEGDVVFVSPDGIVHKSNTKISEADHKTFLSKGANEISRGTVLYKHGGSSPTLVASVPTSASGNRDILVRPTVVDSCCGPTEFRPSTPSVGTSD